MLTKVEYKILCLEGKTASEISKLLKITENEIIQILSEMNYENNIIDYIHSTHTFIVKPV